MNEYLNGTWVYTHFNTHLWGFPFFPDLPATQENMERQYNLHLQLRKLKFLKRVTYLPKLAGSGICNFPGCSWSNSLFPQPHGRGGSRPGLRTEGVDRGLWSSDAFTLPCLNLTML